MNDEDLFGHIEEIKIILERLERRIEYLEGWRKAPNILENDTSLAKCKLCGRYHIQDSMDNCLGTDQDHFLGVRINSLAPWK